MKNHKIIGGRRLQTNKKWSQLKQSQQDWISRITYEEHAAYVEAHGKLPMKKNKQAVIDKVVDRIRERSIWILYHEAKLHISNYYIVSPKALQIKQDDSVQIPYLF